MFPGLCAGTVDVLEKGMRTENIQIIGVEMGGVYVCFAVIERRRIVIPVSYTHLDVYKRQVEMSPYDLSKGRIVFRYK